MGGPPVLPGLLLILATIACGAEGPVEWRWTEGAPGAGRYSPLTDINRTNVGQLRVAWTYRHGDVYDGGLLPDHVNKGTAFEGTPIVTDGRLIFSTPYNRVIALDAQSGRELWTFDPHTDTARRFANMLINRGVAYWGDSAAPSAAAARIFLGTLDARLIALDAASGRPCADFGVDGTVDLLAGLTPVVDSWEYNLTSPPTVVGDVVIVGSSIADTLRRVAPPGDVRAYDVRSGALRWTFHTIPHPGELGDDTWQNDGWRNAGAANVWSTITADLERGLVFLPVSTPSPDFDGADRPGANLFSDSVVALRAATGEHVWHFQTVHHDLWDYDLAAPPVLTRMSPRRRADGKEAQDPSRPGGAVVAQFELPAGLHAGPITYKLHPDGKQYLVIAPGGHIGLGSKQGDYVIAYALP